MIINVNSTYSSIYPLKVTVQLQTKRNNLYPLQFPVNRTTINDNKTIFNFITITLSTGQPQTCLDPIRF